MDWEDEKYVRGVVSFASLLPMQCLFLRCCRMHHCLSCHVSDLWRENMDSTLGRESVQMWETAASEAVSEVERASVNDRFFSIRPVLWGLRCPQHPLYVVCNVCVCIYICMYV